MNSHKIFLGFLIPIVLGSWGCQGRTEGAGSVPIGTPVEIQAPLGLPPVPIPSDNPPTAETISLGRRLYYDPML